MPPPGTWHASRTCRCGALVSRRRSALPPENRRGAPTTSSTRRPVTSTAPRPTPTLHRPGFSVPTSKTESGRCWVAPRFAGKLDVDALVADLEKPPRRLDSRSAVSYTHLTLPTNREV